MATAVDRKGENVIPKVVAMLKELTHRGADAHGVATPNSVKIAKSIEELSVEDSYSSVALGYNLSQVVLKDHPQPILDDDFALVFEGRLFPFPEMSEVDHVVKRLRGDLRKKARSIIEELDGSYTFAIAQAKNVIVGRDNLGASPLYYGGNRTTFAVASEQKALWALGIKNVKSFPPGNLAVISAQGFAFQPIKTAVQPPIESMKMETAATHLQKLLLESVRERVSDVEKLAVAFSGGLDSSVIAALAKACEADVHLVSVGLKDHPEIRHVKAAAETLKLPLHLQTYTIDDVEHVLAKVLWLIEEPDALKVSIAIPFYWTAEVASKLGYRVLLAGQGGDELFGGYLRYLRVYAHSGATAVQEALHRDLFQSYEMNLQRDNQACSFHQVELRLPFLDREVVRFSLSLPLRFKIESMEDRLRKRVLRRAAQNFGIPFFIANKPKKAVQYTTGVDKALRRLAKGEGLSLKEYAKKVFREVYPDVSE
ncbi:MAG: asparagine synthetase B [Candidatus Bathyarchaeota archaeon]|nr:MAG: asparagine synthetase B [Candidatus Bathyarchaeota archaeon]